MIATADLFQFLEGTFGYVLAVDAEERVVHASAFLARTGADAALDLTGRELTDLLTEASLQSFRAAAVEAHAGRSGRAVYAPAAHPSTSIPLRSGRVRGARGGLTIYYGTQLDGLAHLDAWEKDERIKELACIYAVADWIEVSRSVREFFERLPEVLTPGLRYPDDARVVSDYQGVRFGEAPAGAAFIATSLAVGLQVRGEIRVWYRDDAHALLPEEQKMLSEIGRMLSLAIERKELRERISLKREEEEEYGRRIADLEKGIAARTRELEEQHARLATVDSQLAHVNRSWEESRTWLETIFAGIPDDAALIDRNRTVVMTSHRNFVEGSTCHATFFGRDIPCRDCRLARTIREKTPITLTIQHEDRHLEAHAIPIFDKDHEVDGILEFYRDVTKERQYEQQIRQADRLASLGQLISGIGHEINNPNQFIRGNVKILHQALDDMLPIVDAWYADHPGLKIARLPYPFFRQHIMTLVQDMAHGSERIKGIVEGLKRFARRDEGLLIDTVDLNTLIEACARLVHNEVHKHADIRLELAPELPAFTGNSQKIEQVLVNLVVNAGQAMPEDRRGHITVRTRRDAGAVVVEVEDDGKGMNETTLKQIFEPFFTTKRAKGGTGLGLAIAYRIVEEHKGSIDVRSTPGLGTVFTIRFPVGPAAQPSGSAP